LANTSGSNAAGGKYRRTEESKAALFSVVLLECCGAGDDEEVDDSPSLASLPLDADSVLARVRDERDEIISSLHPEEPAQPLELDTGNECAKDMSASKSFSIVIASMAATVPPMRQSSHSIVVRDALARRRAGASGREPPVVSGRNPLHAWAGHRPVGGGR